MLPDIISTECTLNGTIDDMVEMMLTIGTSAFETWTVIEALA
jgi:hypothetical protein